VYWHFKISVTETTVTDWNVAVIKILNINQTVATQLTYNDFFMRRDQQGFAMFIPKLMPCFN